MTICPYCGGKWIEATSNTTGCCDTERVVRGYEPLPKEEFPPSLMIEYLAYMDEDARRQLILESVYQRDERLREVDWEDPPENHFLLGIQCVKCGMIHRFRSISDVPMESSDCIKCGNPLLQWVEIDPDL